MNENIKKIIELSDCEWIQNKWKVKKGDWVFHIPLKEITFVNFVDCNGKFTVHPTFDLSFRSNKNDFYWLPVGFNPESGRLQITDLITELIRTHPSKMVNFWDVHDRLIEIWGLIVK